jgi:copper chaperone CopZ
MTCANCSQTIESFLRGEKGIINVTVNFGTETAKVQYDPSVMGVRDIINLVEEVRSVVLVPSASASFFRRSVPVSASISLTGMMNIQNFFHACQMRLLHDFKDNSDSPVRVGVCMPHTVRLQAGL